VSPGRAYDSHCTNSTGCLGSDWTASWDAALLQLASDLSTNWVEAGMGGLFMSQCLIGEKVSHQVTVTLPDGSTTRFAAQLSQGQGPAKGPAYSSPGPSPRVTGSFMVSRRPEAFIIREARIRVGTWETVIMRHSILSVASAFSVAHRAATESTERTEKGPDCDCPLA